MTPDNLAWVLNRFERIRSNQPEINKELLRIARYLQDITADPDFTPDEIMSYESTDEEDNNPDDNVPEEHIIDKSDPNFISIK